MVTLIETVYLAEQSQLHEGAGVHGVACGHGRGLGGTYSTHANVMTCVRATKVHAYSN